MLLGHSDTLFDVTFSGRHLKNASHLPSSLYNVVLVQPCTVYSEFMQRCNNRFTGRTLRNKKAGETEAALPYPLFSASKRHISACTDICKTQKSTPSVPFFAFR
jgi:hypothetical protein